MRHRERSGKNGTCFTVFSLTIAEKEIPMPNNYAPNDKPVL